MNRITTIYDPPPIPDRRFDWRAMHDPDNSDGRHVGWGATREEALVDLARLDEEREAWRGETRPGAVKRCEAQQGEEDDEQLCCEYETGIS